MTAPLTPEQIAWWRDGLMHSYAMPEIGSMLDEIESSRAKLAAIRQMQPYDAREVGKVLDYDLVHDILDGAA